MLPADTWLIFYEPWNSEDDIKFVIQIQYDEVIIVLLPFHRALDTNYTFPHGD